MKYSQFFIITVFLNLILGKLSEGIYAMLYTILAILMLAMAIIAMIKENEK